MVTVKADDRRRVQIPGIKAGQVFAVEDEGGKVILTPLKKEEPPTIMLKLVKRGDRLVPDLTGLKVDLDDIAKAIREDRDTPRGDRP